MSITTMGDKTQAFDIFQTPLSSHYPLQKGKQFCKICFEKFAFYGLVPEFIDPVFVKTSPKHSFSMTENERFGLVFAKTGSVTWKKEL